MVLYQIVLNGNIFHFMGDRLNLIPVLVVFQGCMPMLARSRLSYRSYIQNGLHKTLSLSLSFKKSHNSFYLVPWSSSYGWSNRVCLLEHFTCTQCSVTL